MRYTVSFYEAPNGQFPAVNFLDTQSAKMQAKIYWTLDLLEERGAELRMPYSEHIADGIFQIRVQAEGIAARVLYFFFVGGEIIVTNGFVKKTPTTPPDELALAKKYRADFLKRQEE